MKFATVERENFSNGKLFRNTTAQQPERFLFITHKEIVLLTHFHFFRIDFLKECIAKHNILNFAIVREKFLWVKAQPNKP